MQQPAQQSQPTPQQVFAEGYQLLKVGDVFEAAKRAGKLRMHFPEDIPILTFHGLVLAKMGVHPQALSDLIKAAQLTEHALDNDEEENPSRPRIVDQLIRLSVEICRSSLAIGEFDAASEAIENALRWDPDRGDAVAAKAELLCKQGQVEEALALIKQGQADVLEELPLVLSKARVLLGSGNSDAEMLGGVVEELETQAKVSGMAALDLGDILRAIGDVNDRLGKFDEAFVAYRRAAKLRKGSYDPRAHAAMTSKVIDEWNSEHISKLVQPEESGERFVLVLGAPHSGADQLGEMLGQLDGVTVLGPSELLSSVCVRHLGARQGVLRPVPFDAAKIRGNQLKEASGAYGTQALAMMGDSSRGIDTHPLNLPLAGAAASFLPGLNIILCRRDPMESVMATYCSAMVGNHPYAGDLINAAGYVLDCNRLLDHWAGHLGAQGVGANVVSVSYSELVDEPKKTAAKVAREIGLDARATAIKSIPVFSTGPGAHPEQYKAYTKPIDGVFDSLAASK